MGRKVVGNKYYALQSKKAQDCICPLMSKPHNGVLDEVKCLTEKCLYWEEFVDVVEIGPNTQKIDLDGLVELTDDEYLDIFKDRPKSFRTKYYQKVDNVKFGTCVHLNK